MGCDSGPWLDVRFMQVSAFSRVRIDRFHCMFIKTAGKAINTKSELNSSYSRITALYES